MSALILKSNACRNCGHHHAYLLSLSTIYSYVISNICLLSMSSGSKGCGCYNFIPLDNLDYLEYKLNEKSNV